MSLATRETLEAAKVQLNEAVMLIKQVQDSRKAMT
jgi:hypothetical protein